MEPYIPKSVVLAEIERRQKEEVSYYEDGSFASWADENHYLTLETIKSFIDTIEVKEVNEVPANVMMNQYGNKYISSWSGLKEYDNFQVNEEIKILIPNK